MYAHSKKVLQVADIHTRTRKASPGRSWDTWIGGTLGGQGGQGALVKDNKIWVMIHIMTPLDTGASDAQGNAGYKSLSEAIIISPFVFHQWQEQKHSNWRRIVQRLRQIVALLYSIFYRERAQPDELWNTLRLVTFDSLCQKACIDKLFITIYTQIINLYSAKVTLWI